MAESNFHENEIWKDIVETDGNYQVSSLGRVRSAQRCYIRSDGRRMFVRGKILKQHENTTGYFRVSIRINGVPKMLFVHRLVATAFICNPYNFDTVNHKDFNPHNNSADNLEWVTRKGNMQYSLNAGRFERTKIWKMNLKTTLDEVMGKPIVGTRIIDGKKLYYKALNDCSKDGFQPSCVSFCCNGKRKTHKGYIWRFANKEDWNAQRD